MKTIITRIGVAMLLTLVATGASAAISSDAVTRLGKDLTPLGAVRAGNASGTIPEWKGGITSPPAGYKDGDHHPDPYPGDNPLFTITRANLDKYRGKLSAGLQKMVETYPTLRLPVYPTRRSATYPKRIYDATRRVATTAKLVAGGSGVTGAVIGLPFPIPKNGEQVIWNHLLRYRGEATTRVIGQAAVTRSGDYTLVRFEDAFVGRYSLPGMTEAKLDNRMILYRQKVAAPARLAGRILLAHETLNQVAEPRHAWVYNPGQRRVRRAPNVAYDNPGTASDGLRTSDQFDMFNGALDRYDWKLLGKREMYVPYNSYKLHSDKITFADVLKPLHVNPKYLRYELHRVWVVEATLKEGARHLYKKRRFYVDEDSWMILLVDIYDNRDQLWRVSEGHVINYYEIPLMGYTLEVHTDLQAGRYLALGLNNEYPMSINSTTYSEKDFLPSALRRMGRR